MVGRTRDVRFVFASCIEDESLGKKDRTSTWDADLYMLLALLKDDTLATLGAAGPNLLPTTYISGGHGRSAMRSTHTLGGSTGGLQ